MGGRVLIVEDEPDIRDLLAFHLEREGYHVTRSRTGADALRQVRARPPDLILLDLMLPELGGLDVCRRLRQDPRTASVPIVMLTARGEEVDRILGLGATLVDDRRNGDRGWAVLADPEGNEFCVLNRYEPSGD